MSRKSQLHLIMTLLRGRLADGGAASIDKMFGLNLGGLIGWLGILLGIIAGVVAANVRSPEAETAEAEADTEEAEKGEGRKAA